MHRSIPISVNAALVLSVGLASSLQAGLHLGKGACCDGAKCNTEVVELPAQRVVVETARPQVVVQQAPMRHHARVAAAPMMASPFVASPMVAAPMVATVLTPAQFSIPSPTFSEVRTSNSLSSLRALHDFQEQTFELRRMKAVQDAEMKETANALKQASDTLQASLKSFSVSTDSLSETGQNGTQLSSDLANLRSQIQSASNVTDSKLQKLEETTKKLTQLVSYHDEALKRSVVGSSKSLDKSIQDLCNRVDRIEKLLSVHDEYLQKKISEQKSGAAQD